MDGQAVEDQAVTGFEREFKNVVPVEHTPVGAQALRVFGILPPPDGVRSGGLACPGAVPAPSMNLPGGG